jgi:hypothetical protein
MNVSDQRRGDIYKEEQAFLSRSLFLAQIFLSPAAAGRQVNELLLFRHRQHNVVWVFRQYFKKFAARGLFEILHKEFSLRPSLDVRFHVPMMLWCSVKTEGPP